MIQSPQSIVNAHLHLDDDIARYLSKQAEEERTTLDAVLNRLLRRALPTKPASASSNPSWLEEVRILRVKCSTDQPGTPVEELIAEIRS